MCFIRINANISGDRKLGKLTWEWDFINATTVIVVIQRFPEEMLPHSLLFCGIFLVRYVSVWSAVGRKGEMQVSYKLT